MSLQCNDACCSNNKSIACAKMPSCALPPKCQMALTALRCYMPLQGFTPLMCAAARKYLAIVLMQALLGTDACCSNNIIIAWAPKPSFAPDPRYQMVVITLNTVYAFAGLHSPDVCCCQGASGNGAAVAVLWSQCCCQKPSSKSMQLLICFNLTEYVVAAVYMRTNSGIPRQAFE